MLSRLELLKRAAFAAAAIAAPKALEHAKPAQAAPKPRTWPRDIILHGGPADGRVLRYGEAKIARELVVPVVDGRYERFGSATYVRGGFEYPGRIRFEYAGTKW